MVVEMWVHVKYGPCYRCLVDSRECSPNEACNACGITMKC